MSSFIISTIPAVIFSTIISILWVRGIDSMKKNHPDYKGDDFLNGLD